MAWETTSIIGHRVSQNCLEWGLLTWISCINQWFLQVNTSTIYKENLMIQESVSSLVCSSGRILSPAQDLVSDWVLCFSPWHFILNNQQSIAARTSQRHCGQTNPQIDRPMFPINSFFSLLKVELNVFWNEMNEIWKIFFDHNLPRVIWQHKTTQWSSSSACFLFVRTLPLSAIKIILQFLILKILQTFPVKLLSISFSV